MCIIYRLPEKHFEAMGAMEADRELGNVNGCHHHGEGLEQQLGKEHENKNSNVDYAVDIDVESANGEFGQEQIIEGDAGMKPQTQSKQYRLRRAISDVRFKAHLARVLPDRKVLFLVTPFDMLHV